MTTEPIPRLDDLATMQSIDKRNMLRIINEVPEQYETAMGIARNMAVEPLSERPNVLFMTGIGDSAVAAEMAAAVLGSVTDAPVVTNRGERIPRCVGEDSLVFVIDYSGKSELTLRNYKEARSRGARVVCITSGGNLSEAANRDGVKIVRILPGQPQRTAIGYLFAPIVVAVEKLGLVTGPTESLSHAVRLMKNVREGFRFESPTSRNLAKRTAEAMYGKMIGIYGAGDYRTAVLSRWKSLLNANSKVLALTGTYPDVTESEISGYEMAGRQCGRFGVILLRDASDRGEIAELMDASKEVLATKFDVVEVELKGATTVEKMLYGSFLGNYVSYYLALLYGVDPMRTDNISHVQSRLAGEEVEGPDQAEEEEQDE